MSSELEQYIDSELSLERLVSEVGGILGRVESKPADARVAGIPDARTLRHYQTINLLDKPLRYEGRKALYGYRHLLQALGIKLLQGQGYSLAQIERTLTRMDLAELEQVVVEALGESQAVPSAPPPIPTLTAGLVDKALIAVEVGDGVSVILDPSKVEDPEVVLVAMRELVSAIEDGL